MVGRADGLFPLTRIARVITIGRVHWQPGALTECFNQGKPVAVLDRGGRFIRILYERSTPQYGLPRRMADLLAIRRFGERYQSWLRDAEASEARSALRRLSLGIQPNEWQPDRAWRMIYAEQLRRQQGQLRVTYRYLLGLAAAQAACAMAATELPRDPANWDRWEYRIFKDIVRLERWHVAVLVENLFGKLQECPERWELTSAFESASTERSRRIENWRRAALARIVGRSTPGANPAEVIGNSEPVPAGYATNCDRIRYGAPGSLRTSARIMREYLDYDRRTHATYRAA